MCLLSNIRTLKWRRISHSKIWELNQEDRRNWKDMIKFKIEPIEFRMLIGSSQAVLSREVQPHHSMQLLKEILTHRPQNHQ